MTYTFQCANENCKYEFAIDQNINEKHEANCPKCQREDKNRIKSIINDLADENKKYEQTEYNQGYLDALEDVLKGL